MVNRFWLWMIIAVWKSYQQNVWGVCSQLISTAIVGQLQRSIVLALLNCNERDLLQFHYRGRNTDSSHIVHLRPNCSRNSRFLRAKNAVRDLSLVMKSSLKQMPYSRTYKTLLLERAQNIWEKLNEVYHAQKRLVQK